MSQIELRRLITILESLDETPDDDDFDDQSAAQKPSMPYEFLNTLKNHKERQHRYTWRNKQRRRYQRETDAADGYDGDMNSNRHIAKSQIGYKPFKLPLIRFGKFRKVSQVFLNPDDDENFGQDMIHPSHEVGVSCFSGHAWKDGFLVVPPMIERAVYSNTDEFGIIRNNFQRQLIAYLDHQVPMDIFLVHGHLAAFGKDKEMLSLGSDGEYLLDTSKPYESETIEPERVYMHQTLNLIQWFEASYRGGIAKIRSDIQDEDDSIR